MCPCCTYLEHSARGGAGSTCLDTKQACGPHPTESPRNTCCTIIPHLSTRILCIVSFPHTYSRASQVSWDVSSLWYIRGRRQQPDSARGDYAWLRTLSSHTCTATTTFRLVKGDFGVEDPLRGLRAVVCPEYSGVVVSWACRAGGIPRQAICKVFTLPPRAGGGFGAPLHVSLCTIGMQQLISTHTHTKLPPLCVQASQACGGTARENTRQSTLPTLAVHTRAREHARSKLCGRQKNAV